MRCLLYRFFTIFCLFLTACSPSVLQIPENGLGKVLELKSGKFITTQELAEKLSVQPRVILGEQHDSLKHHQAQYWLLQQLQRQRPQASLLLEMLSIDQQSLADNLKYTASLNELPKQLNWQKSWNWAFYGAIVHYAVSQKTALVATNLTSNEIQTLMQGAEPLRGNQSVAPNIKQQLARLILASHHCQDCSLGTPMVQKMVEIQQFRDRRMAEKLLTSATPSLLIAGNHHANRAYGVPVHLSELSQKAAATVVMMVSQTENLNVQNADYLWILSE